MEELIRGEQNVRYVGHCCSTYSTKTHYPDYYVLVPPGDCINKKRSKASTKNQRKALRFKLHVQTNKYKDSQD